MLGRFIYVQFFFKLVVRADAEIPQLTFLLHLRCNLAATHTTLRRTGAGSLVALYNYHGGMEHHVVFDHVGVAQSPGKPHRTKNTRCKEVSNRANATIQIKLENIRAFLGGFPAVFYCGKTTVLSVRAVTVIKHNYLYRATRYREKTHLPIPCKTLPRNS